MVLGSWKNLQEGQREDLDGVHPGIKESGLLSQGQGHALATMAHMQRSIYDSGRDTGTTTLWLPWKDHLFSLPTVPQCQGIRAACGEMAQREDSGPHLVIVCGAPAPR